MNIEERKVIGCNLTPIEIEILEKASNIIYDICFYARTNKYSEVKCIDDNDNEKIHYNIIHLENIYKDLDIIKNIYEFSK